MLEAAKQVGHLYLFGHNNMFGTLRRKPMEVKIPLKV